MGDRSPPPRSPARDRSRSRSPPRRSRSRSPLPPPRDSGDEPSKKKMSVEDEVGRQVYVGNLNFHTDKGLVEDAFGEYGKVVDVYLPLDPDGRPRGFCFVTFEEKREAEACALGMNGRDFDGRVIRCNIARPRPTEPRDQPRRRDDGPRDRRDDRGGGGRDYDRRDDRREERRRPPPREARIFVEGLPEDIKERELDDLYYRYGRIDYIEIRRPRDGRMYGIICYFDSRDAEYARRETDGMRFEKESLRVDLDR